jgi:two-component system, OmpR family, response regulator CpxR
MMASVPNSGPRTRILVIDDDTKLCRLIRDYLEPMGYEVEAAHDGNSGLRQALAGGFGAIILDVMLPGKDGLEVLRHLRAESNIPVLMLTGRGEEPDRIIGLELGADDYLPKTFSTRELLARLRAVIRRASTIPAKADADVPHAIVVGDLRIDPASRSASLGAEPLQLTAVEFDLLKTLASSAGRIQSREQLLLQIADRDFDVFGRSIDVHISSLRKKLGDDPKTPKFIVTVRSAGYMMRKAGSQVEF